MVAAAFPIKAKECLESFVMRLFFQVLSQDPFPAMKGE